MYIENPKKSIGKNCKKVNLAISQDQRSVHKNQLHFYILATNNEKWNGIKYHLYKIKLKAWNTRE